MMVPRPLHSAVDWIANTVRNIVFVSHANPEDNNFALWLTLQLANQGYAAWCDLTKLLGGEDFWVNIETAIRERTVKFLYVLSKASNQKLGTLKELAVAEAVAKSHSFDDFIIPLKIDDLPHSQINVQLNRLNAIAFNRGWTAGLQRLIEKLEEDGVPKTPTFSPSAVSEWWRRYRAADEGIASQPEEYLTNWFPIQQLPETIHFHHLARYGGGVTEFPKSLPYPAVKLGAYVTTFATAEELEPFIDESHQLTGSDDCTIDTFLAGISEPLPIQKREARGHLANLLRQAWELELERRGIPIYNLSGKAKCGYFTKGLVEDDRIAILGVNGERSFRQLVGYKTTSRRMGQEPVKRYWHFGIQLKPLVYPVRAIAVKPHVLFSSDGQNLLGSVQSLHRARRSVCKDWWNADWRDRILAAMTWFAGEQGQLVLPVSSTISLSIRPFPITLSSPVSFQDPESVEPPFDVDVEDDWEEDKDESEGEAA